MSRHQHDSDPFADQAYGQAYGEGYGQHISYQSPQYSNDPLGAPSRGAGDAGHTAYPPYAPSDLYGSYQPIDGSNEAYGAVQREKGNPCATRKNGGGSRKKRWWIGGIGLLALIGIAVGIAVWKTRGSPSSSSSGSGSSTGGPPTPVDTNKLAFIQDTAGAVKSNPDDPSQFETDSRLHRSLWAVAYTPFLAQEPWCGATLANVTEDIQILSQLTTRLRLYGAACNISSLVLQAIKDTKVDMTVWLGVYIGTDETVNEQQMQMTLDVIREYGTDHIAGVTVGNEYILNATPRSVGITFIIDKMATFRTRLAALNLPKALPVGTADAGSVFTLELAEAADEFFANVHPFFASLNIGEAAAWTTRYFEETDVAIANASVNKPPTYIAETGWPTDSLTAENLTYGASVAGIPQLQTFLDTFVCQANANNTHYFYFSAFDEPWKGPLFGGVEPYWGLMDSNKRLKAGITIPSC